jgi:hypothetical protein
MKYWKKKSREWERCKEVRADLGRLDNTFSKASKSTRAPEIKLKNSEGLRSKNARKTAR